MTVVLIRTNSDGATEKSHGFGEEAKQICSECGLPVLDLSGRKATRCRLDKLARSLVKHEAVFVIYAHCPQTDGDMIEGQCGGAILDDRNLAAIEGAGVFAAVCWIGKKLGKAMVKKGARYFIGWTEAIYLVPGYESKVGECLNHGVRQMLQDPNDPERAAEAIRLSVYDILTAYHRAEEPLSAQACIAFFSILDSLVVYPERVPNAAA
jgi:hypothetical protein